MEQAPIIPFEKDSAPEQQKEEQNLSQESSSDSTNNTNHLHAEGGPIQAPEMSLNQITDMIQQDKDVEMEDMQFKPIAPIAPIENSGEGERTESDRESEDHRGDSVGDQKEQSTSLIKALENHDRQQLEEDSESSNTSGEDELGNMSDGGSDNGDDSSSGDSIEDIPTNHITFHQQNMKSVPNKFSIGSSPQEAFKLEGTLNEGDMNQENSNSANENSAENNLENFEVDEDEDDMMRYGYPEEEDEMMMNDEEYDKYKHLYGDMGGMGKKKSKRIKVQSLQGFLDERGNDSDDEEDMMHQMDLDDSDQDDEDMMMERDSDDDDDMAAEYSNYLKLKLNKEGLKRRMGDNLSFSLASMMRSGGKKKQRQNILSEPQKDNIHQILDQIKITNNSIRKIQLQTEIKDRNFKFLNDLGMVFDMLDERHKEERTPQIDASIKSDTSGESLRVEKNESTLNDDRIQKIAMVYKYVMLFGDQNIIEAMLSDRFYKQTFGALEFLTDVLGHIECRKFIENAKFKQVVEIQNPLILKKIHVCYRATYLKETIFAKDDNSGQVPQHINLMIMNFSMDIMTYLLNDQTYLSQVYQLATNNQSSLQECANAVQFVYDIVYQIKTYHQYLTTMSINKLQHIPHILIDKIKIFEIIKFIFKKDMQVQNKVQKLQGYPTLSLSQMTLQGSSMSKDDELQAHADFSSEEHKSMNTPIMASPMLSDTFNNNTESCNETFDHTFDLEQKHSRFTDMNLYDFMLTQLLDVLNLLMQIFPKEFVEKFSEDIEISQQLGQHFFFSKNESIHQQIIEIIKTTLDQSGGNIGLQQNLERILINSLLPLFKGILLDDNKCIDRSEFGDQIWMMFEFMQQMCKPMINSLLPDPRQGITQVILQYIKVNKFAKIAMLEVSNINNSVMHRMMALKFIKSLFTLNDREIIVEIKEADLFGCVSSIIEECIGKQRNINMFQSATLELLNQFCELVRNIFGTEEFKTISAIYMDEFNHARNLLPQLYTWNIKRSRPLAPRNGQVNLIPKQPVRQQPQQQKPALVTRKRTFSMSEIVRSSFDDESDFKIQASLSEKARSESGDLDDYTKRIQEVSEMNKQAQVYKQFKFKESPKEESKFPVVKNLPPASWVDSDDEDAKQSEPEPVNGGGGSLISSFMQEWKKAEGDQNKTPISISQISPLLNSLNLKEKIIKAQSQLSDQKQSDLENAPISEQQLENHLLEREAASGSEEQS